MGDGNEITVGNKTIGENTKISLSVKTALWIISGVIVLFSSVLTAAYFKVEADMQDFKQTIEVNNKQFLKEIEVKIDSKFDKQDLKNDKFIEDMTQMRINIQQLLDRTQSIQPASNTNQTIHNNTPESSIPENKSH